MATITINNVSKAFGNNTVLRQFNEKFEEGEFITLLGPSGCGKTTMLRIIAGFEKPTAGEVWIDDQLVSGPNAFVPPERRGIGMVFQSYAVWPHMNVFDNVAYPLKIAKKPNAYIKSNVERVLEIVHLTQYAQRIPSQLSGGQQQRVALARALVAEPRLLLLDEPLSNLDAKLRESMRFEIKEIQRSLGISVVYVTHDQTEAMAMSDRIFIINAGVVQQVGTPEDVYKRPVNRFVADFVGKVDFLAGEAEKGFITVAGQKIAYDGDKTGSVTVAIRPENAVMLDERSDKIPCIEAEVMSCFYLGDVYDCRVKLKDSVLRVIVPYGGRTIPKSGQKLFIGLREYMVFEKTKEDELKILT